jgi:hypothetical protein
VNYQIYVFFIVLIKFIKINELYMIKLLITILILSMTVVLNAQDNEIIPQDKTNNYQDNVKLNQDNSFTKDKNWFFEGTVIFSLGTQSQLGVTPLIGYRINPDFHAGASLTYYHLWNNTYPDNPTQSDVFGGSIILRWVPIRELFFQFEPAVYSQKVYSSITTYENKGVPFLFVGAGYNYYLNPDIFLTFQIKIDVLRDESSPYGDTWHPFFNAGVGFGL